MHSVISIEEMRKQFEEKVKSEDPKELAHVQQSLIEDLILRNKRLEEKLVNAENKLKSLEKNGSTSQVSAEELICVEQIEVLKAKSSERELSTDEVKRLDLLIKNLKILRAPIEREVVEAEYSEEQLVRLIEGI